MHAQPDRITASLVAGYQRRQVCRRERQMAERAVYLRGASIGFVAGMIVVALSIVWGAR